MEEGRQKQSVTKCEGIFFFIGSILVVGGAALAVSRYAQKTAERAVESSLIPAPNSTMVNAWKDPTTPVYMRFYVFNVTNGDSILRGEKPVLEEHGPYTYRMVSPRFDIEFFPNDTVAFRNNNTLYFEPHLSNGSEDDVLYHINIPLVTMGQKMKEQHFVGEKLLKRLKVPDKLLGMVGHEDLFVPHTVKEIIFGYDEPMFNAVGGLMSLFGKDIDPVFGPFHGFNNSDDGLFLVRTGKKDFKQFNVIERWNGETLLPYWSTDYANMLNGTDGSFLKPKVRRNETRYLYFPQMRRSSKLEYEMDTSVKGVDAYRYHFAEDLLENATSCPDNIGFCVPEDNCFDSGLLNVGSFGNEKAPMFLSLPHFYQGSERLQKSVVGLTPNKTLHDSFFHIEPMTGAVVLGQRRLQINVHVTQGEYLESLRNIQPVFFPYFWLSGEAYVSDEVAGDLRMAITIVALTSYIGYVVIAIGAIMVLVTLGRRHCRRKRETASDEEPLLREESDVADRVEA